MCLHCIGKYQIAPSKAVVGVDWLMKAYKSPIREKLSAFSKLSFCQKIIFLNQIPSCMSSMCLHCIGKYQIAPLKAMVEVDRPVYGF